MRQTVLITGTSTGIGRAAVFAFQRAGWNVIATMRSPEKEVEFKSLQNVLCARLDVTDDQSIVESIKEGIARFEGIDVVVNNAGYGLVGVFEDASSAQIARQFDTNVFGLMNVTRALLPHFRERGRGRVINISSVGGRLTFPLHSLYHATKWAVDGFSEALRFELQPQGIDVKIVEPGAIKTDFYSRSKDPIEIRSGSSDLRRFVAAVSRNADRFGKTGTAPERVADVIVKAATDSSRRLRYVVGPDAKAMLFLRALVPHSVYEWLVRTVLARGQSERESGHDARTEATR